MPDERGVEARLLQATMVPGKYCASLALLRRMEQNNLLKKSKNKAINVLLLKADFRERLPHLTEKALCVSTDVS